MMIRLSASILLPLALATQAAPTLRPDPPKACFDCDEWNAAQEGFRLFGNTYYVGTAGLSALLVTSDAGHVLLDGGLPQSAARIDANIRALGFRTEDVRFILASHAHYDHVGGIAALQRLSGATVAMSAAGVRALAGGGPTPDDPQYGIGVEANAFPPVVGARAVADGETIRVGPLAITAHLTPGHTPGGTSWSWRSCEGDRCVDVVYADSLTAVSADGFRFTGGDGRPDITPVFMKSIDTVGALGCDIIVSTHPGATGLARKIARRDAGAGPEAFVDPGGCRAYAAGARRALERRIAEERP
ncbi:MAG: subclass B3 metallo-beta-lactamase [Vicinamibacterales bacterium]